jgi:UDP-N-acetylmuramoyl-L-alanyl-D-glutamate--2,6-diaminopimelate ligase
VLKRAENIDFKIGLYTNFTRDHLDFHNTMEEYLAAKKLFLSKLEGNNKTVVINKDVPEYIGFIPDAKCRVMTYSADGHDADIMIRSAELLPDRSSFELVTPLGASHITIRLLGRYNLANVAGAAAAAVAFGIDLPTIASALETLEPVPGRFRPVMAGQPFTVLVDYAHTPDAIERLCLSAREITRGRVIIIFGCGGDRDKGKRPIMGGAATKHSDFAVITSDNPRTEEPLKIIDDILPGVNGINYKVVPDRRLAIRQIVKMAQPGDTVLLAGKGAEDYQEIGTQKIPYDDTTEVFAALAEIGYKG